MDSGWPNNIYIHPEADSKHVLYVNIYSYIYKQLYTCSVIYVA